MVGQSGAVAYPQSSREALSQVKPQSCKAKGRKLQQEIRDAILATFPGLSPDDVRSTSMGASGEDVLLSPAAREMVPFSIESKNVESLNIWKALQQASGRKYPPLVVFRRNHSPTFAALPFDTFLMLLRNAAGDCWQTKEPNGEA